MFQKKSHIPLTIVFIRLAGSCQKLSLLRSSSMRSKGHPVTHLLFESRSRLKNNSLLVHFFRLSKRSTEVFELSDGSCISLQHYIFLFRFCISFSTQHKMPFFVRNIPFAFKSSVYLLSYLNRCPNYVKETQYI